MTSILPNTFMTPNVYVDEAMALLTSDEYKVLSFATRHILGWQDRIQKRQWCISLSTFENGFTTADGTRYGGCGLARATVVKVLASLVVLGFLTPVGEPTEDGQMWHLNEDVHWDALMKRQEEQAKRTQERLTKINDAKRAKKAAEQAAANEGGGSSHEPGEGVHGMNQQRFMPRTDSGSSHELNQNQYQNQYQNQAAAKGAAAASDASAIDGDLPERPNVFSYYENALGPLTPTLADLLKQAAEEWPDEWLRDAFQETAESNGRSWKYTKKILLRWQRDGKGAPSPATSSAKSNGASKPNTPPRAAAHRSAEKRPAGTPDFITELSTGALDDQRAAERPRTMPKGAKRT